MNQKGLGDPKITMMGSEDNRVLKSNLCKYHSEK